MKSKFSNGMASFTAGMHTYAHMHAPTINTLRKIQKEDKCTCYIYTLFKVGVGMKRHIKLSDFLPDPAKPCIRISSEFM